MDNQNPHPKQALLERLKQSTNILVTVGRNPTIDQLAACLGLTLWLNKSDKHATAVFSGEVPSTLEFLQPEDTLEKNTNSLRDFIISLDKSKADKLRYKVEDEVVKIFITPYRTSLSADDLEFSQGDFNVDMIIALGVNAQEDLDSAITAHGRILHDATVATITTDTTSQLGSISWHDPAASSLSEIIVDLGDSLDRTQLDGQIATALLTGIVSATERFGNQKTTPQTMSISAQLLSAGANQQLVADELAAPAQSPAPLPSKPAQPEETPVDEPPKPGNGTIEINHDVDVTMAPPEPQAAAEPIIRDVKATDKNDGLDATATPQPTGPPSVPKYVSEPPQLGGTLTANSRPDDIMREPSADPLSHVTDSAVPLLDRDNTVPTVVTPPTASVQPAPPTWMPTQQWLHEPTPVAPAAVDANGKTLSEIEQEVASSHIELPNDNSDLSTAREDVLKAVNSVPDANPEPIQALNAQPIDLPITHDDPPQITAPPLSPNQPVDPELTVPAEQPFTMPLPTAPPPAPTMSPPRDPNAPPPVPPPLMPPGFPGA